MDWIRYWNRKIRKLSIVDLKLVQVGSMAAILIIAKWFPQIMNVSIWWFVGIFIICMMRPFYVFWIEGDNSDGDMEGNKMNQRMGRMEEDVGDIKEQIADFIIKQDE